MCLWQCFIVGDWSTKEMLEPENLVQKMLGCDSRGEEVIELAASKVIENSTSMVYIQGLP